MISSKPSILHRSKKVNRLSTPSSRKSGVERAEVDVDGAYDDGRLVTDDVDDIDYVIAGFHYIPTDGSYPFSPDDCPFEPEKFFSLWRKSLFGIVTNPKVDTLAHPGRLAAMALDMDVYFEDVLGVFEAAAKLSAGNNVAWEINELTGARLSFAYQQQWHRIYRIAVEAGVKLVYGSDAHEPLAVGRQLISNMILEKLPAGCLAWPDEAVRSKRK